MKAFDEKAPSRWIAVCAYCGGRHLRRYLGAAGARCLACGAPLDSVWREQKSRRAEFDDTAAQTIVFIIMVLFAAYALSILFSY